MSEEKDKMFQASSAKFGKNSKGNDRVQFYLTKEASEEMAVAIATLSGEGSGTGVLIDIHQTKGETKEGKPISGGIAFVKAKQAQQTQQQTKKSYTPKNDQQSVIDRLKNKQVN